MTQAAAPTRLPVPIPRPRRLPAVVRAASADTERRRDAAEAYAEAPVRRGPRGRIVDLEV